VEGKSEAPRHATEVTDAPYPGLGGWALPVAAPPLPAPSMKEAASALSVDGADVCRFSAFHWNFVTPELAKTFNGFHLAALGPVPACSDSGHPRLTRSWNELGRPTLDGRPARCRGERGPSRPLASERGLDLPCRLLELSPRRLVWRLSSVTHRSASQPVKRLDERSCGSRASSGHRSPRFTIEVMTRPNLCSALLSDAQR
jgi:hypothetical protein